MYLPGKIVFYDKSLINPFEINREFNSWRLKTYMFQVDDEYRDNFLNFLFEYGYIQLWIDNNRIDIFTSRIPWLKNKGIIVDNQILEINKYSDYIWKQYKKWKGKS